MARGHQTTRSDNRTDPRYHPTVLWIFIVMLMLANMAAWFALRKGRLVLAQRTNWTRSRRLQRLTFRPEQPDKKRPRRGGANSGE